MNHAETLQEMALDLSNGDILDEYDATTLDEIADYIEQLEALLKECADDLEERVDQEYPDRNQYPDMMRRYDRDMDIVNRARAAIATSAEED